MACYFFDWLKTDGSWVRAGSWLMVGKGPTFDRLTEDQLLPYRLLTLNDVSQALHTRGWSRRVDLAHVIDLDVISRMSESLRHTVNHLVMPYYPHQSNRPSHQNIDNVVASIPVLRELDDAGRLLYYRSSLAVKQTHPKEATRVVETRFFSSTAAFNLLALAGVKRVRTVGIDGGTRYADAFADLTPLTNGQATFDVQSPVLRASAKRHGVDLASLGG